MSTNGLASILAEISTTHADERGRLLKALASVMYASVVSREGLDEELFTDIAISLLAKATIFERMAFANAVADAGHGFARLIEHLLKDVAMVTRRLIERGSMSDDMLCSLVDNCTKTDRSVLTALARRAGLSSTVSDRLIESGHDDVRLALAGNLGAKISLEGFMNLTRSVEAQGDMDHVLAQRDDLPEPIAKLLHRRLAEATAKRLSSMIDRDLARRRPAFVLKST